MCHDLFRASLRKLPIFALIVMFAIGLTLIPKAVLHSSAASPRSTIQFVSPSWVATNAKDSNLRILDVRTIPLDYIEGHLPGAINIADNAFRGPNGFLPVQYWDSNQLTGLFTRAGVTNKSKVLVYPSDNIIVSCSTGREATLQYVVLKHLLGYPNVRVYEGSWTEYSTTDLPIATGAEPTT